MKHPKAGKVDRQFARRLCDSLFNADFPRRTYRIKAASFIDQLGELDKGAAGDEKKRLFWIKMRIRGAEILAKGDDAAQDCLEYGLSCGIAFSMVCMRMARVRGYGRTENPIWDFVRQVYSENRSVKKSSVVRTAIERFKKSHPKARSPKPDYLEKHFSSKVVKSGHT
jgi:hypothetical protein